MVCRFFSIVGLGTVYFTDRVKYGTKNLWTWSLQRRAHVYAVLATFYPWLGGRRKEKAASTMAAITPVVGRRKPTGKTTEKRKAYMRAWYARKRLDPTFMESERERVRQRNE